jgi:hypothetical protein
MHEEIFNLRDLLISVQDSVDHLVPNESLTQPAIDKIKSNIKECSDLIRPRI